MHRNFYEGHFSIMVICAEIGFIVSLVVLVLALISIRSKWKAVVAAGSLIIAYLWFSDIAWWVMVK
jgi:predicted membrane metal-binding protein